MAGPDAPGRSVQDVAVIDWVVRQRQRVAAVRRRPDRLAELARRLRIIQGESTTQDRNSEQAGTNQACARRSPGLANRGRRDREQRPRQHARPAQGGQAERGTAQQAVPTNPAGTVRQTPRASKNAVGVSVITDRLCHTSTGSQATMNAAKRALHFERPEPRAALAVNQTVPAPSARCKRAIAGNETLPRLADQRREHQRVKRRPIGRRPSVLHEALRRRPASGRAAGSCRDHQKRPSFATITPRAGRPPAE